MQFQNLVCANCGGTDFEKLSDREYRCTHCKGLLVSAEKPEPFPQFQYPPEREPVVPPSEPVPIFAKAMGSVMLLLIAIIFIAFFGQKSSKPASTLYGSGNGATTAPGSTRTSPTPVQPKLKIEVIGKVKGSFGITYVKCLVTNITENVLRDPTITLILYKKDVKLGSVMGQAGLKYLKPKETTPIWVDLNDHADYTRAEAAESMMFGVFPYGNKITFPELKFIDAKMTTNVGNSSYNGQMYREKFYNVTGVIQNELYEKVAPQLFVVFYDAKSEVVGVESGSPPELNKGEKANFEISAGETQLFGAPVRYEIIAVDPYGK